MADKYQNHASQYNSWQQQQPYYMQHNPYMSGQQYGHQGYVPGQYFYFNSGMGFNPNVPPGHHYPFNQLHQDLPTVDSSRMTGESGNQQVGNEARNPSDMQNNSQEANILPPLPPGPPPPLPNHCVQPTGSNSPLITSPHMHNQQNNSQSTPIKFSLPNKKPNLGFSPFKNLRGGKKKRKKNKNKNMNNFGNVNTNTPVQKNNPPLPPNEVYPPLPPLPQEPAPPLPEDMDVNVHIDLMGNPPEQFSGCSTLEERAAAAVNSQNQTPISGSPENSNTLNERKFIALKETYSPSIADSGNNSTPKHPIGPGRKSNISAALSSRLGDRPHYRSPKSRSPVYKSRRNRSQSKSPNRRKRRSESSSSSDENFIPLTSRKRRSRFTDKEEDHVSSRGKGRNRKNGRNVKSHFYSEYGLVGGDLDDSNNSDKLQQRAARFNSSLKSNEPDTPSRRRQLGLITFINNSNVDGNNLDSLDLSACYIIGTCQDLEKPYLRLTSAPDASAIRPVDVLKKSLKMVKERWVKTQDYHYLCDQMKSIRQDLTVQKVRDEFTVEVYETHARVCLEKGDHEEFNQCQNQLKMLYSEIGGSNYLEFTCYRILYCIFTKNTLDMTTILTHLTPEEKENPCISYALQLHSAWWLGNYHKFFRLYQNAPCMAAYLVDWFADRERKIAIKCMVKSYRPLLPIHFVTKELSFESVAKCVEFITALGLTMDKDGTNIDGKASVSVLSTF